MTDHDGPNVAGVHVDYLLEPEDLKEIMAKLRGESFTLEELALTLLAGGIELEYLRAKYKTSVGYKNLLLVIACQDSLVVDWDDLERRCAVVIDAVVADYHRRLEEEGGHAPSSPVEGPPEEEILHTPSKGKGAAEEPPQNTPEEVRSDGPPPSKVELLSGGIAPVWSEPHRGPAQRSDPGITPGPDLGPRPFNTDEGKPPRLQKEAEELLAPKGYKGLPSKVGIGIEVLLRMLKDDISKWKYISDWSEKTLSQVLFETKLDSPLLPSGGMVRSGPG